MTKLVLVNKEHPIKQSYIDKIKLVDTKDKDGNDILIEEETYSNYLELKDYLKSIGLEVVINSAYRSMEEQQEIMKEYIEKYGEEEAKTRVASLGTSEHHTGLVIDLGIQLEKLEDEEEMKKLRESKYQIIHKHLSKFGFILRYPKGKEEITGYRYEPWHIRYVGEFVANILYKNNWTLEEYLSDFSGLLVVNKEKGMTSFDVVHEISRLFGIKKVGHTGTLDPMAEGVLIVAIGKATKIVELLTASYKEYVAGVKLGIRTDTRDITGKIIDSKEVENISNLEEVLQTFQKTYFQEVPIYSAVKVNGKKLYEYARNNQSVELPKKEVTIQEIELLNKDKNTFTFRTVVSKGTYIRSLIDDIGKDLGTFATMTSLTRTKQGKMDITKASTLKDIRNGNYHLYSIDELLDYPVIEVDEELEFKIKNGQKLRNTFQILSKVIFKNKNKQLLGIYQNIEDELRVFKNF